MKILENISSGYKRIATGIAVVAFLSMLYLAMIPGASVAYIYGPAGGVISGAFVFIKEWPQYNDTTATDGSYAIEQMPIGDYTFVAAGNDSFAPYIAPINVTVGNNNLPDITLNPAINYYLPFLYHSLDNTYNAAVQIQNNGTSDDDVEIPLYSLAGTIAANNFYSTEPGKLMTQNVVDIKGTSSTFVGPAKIKSNFPVQVQGYIKTEALGVYSIAPSLNIPTNHSFVPFLYQNKNPVVYDAGLIAYNPGDVATNVTIKLYSLAGAELANNTYLVAPKASVAKYVFDMITGVNIFVGPAEIISEQPVVAQGYIRTSNGGIYSIAPSINEAVLEGYVPFLYQNKNPEVYDAGIVAFNPGNVATNVTIKLYSLAGVEMGNNTYLVAPKASVAKYVFDMVTGVNIFVGPAKITSEQPVVSQGYIRTKENNLNAYSIAPQVRKPASAGEVHMPFLYQTVNNSHDSGIIAFNPNNAWANIDIAMYYPNGTKVGNVTQSVGPYASITKYVFDIAPNNIDFDGYAIVSANQSVVAQGYIRKVSSKIYSIAPPVER